MLQYNKPIYGYIYYKDRKVPKTHKITIFSANALCAMVEVTPIPRKERKNPNERYKNLIFGFYEDEKHIEDIAKHDKELLPINSKWVKKIELNLAYKESWILLKYFVKANYKCKVYYKEEIN